MFRVPWDVLPQSEGRAFWARSLTQVPLMLVAMTIGSMTPMASVARAQAPQVEVQTWTDESGKYKIQAKFIKLDGDTLQLESAEGKQLNVPFSKLNFSSQLQARKLADPKAYEPPVLPSTLAAPPLRESPLPDDPTIEQFLDAMKKELSEENMDVLWHALTPEMQQDTEAIVIKAAEIAGPKFFKQLQAVLPNALTIVRDKRSMILAHPRIVRNPEVIKNLSQMLPAIEPMMEVFTRPETWSSENFKTGKVGAWLVVFMNDLNKAQKPFEALLKQNPSTKAIAGGDIKKLTYKVIEKSTDTAKVSFEGEGVAKQEISFKKTGKSWLPAEMVDNWPSNIAIAKSQLDGMDKSAVDQLRMSLSTGLTFANGILGSLANAKTQAEFNQLLEPWMGQIDQFMRGFASGMNRQSTPGMGPDMGGMPPPGGNGVPSSRPGRPGFP